ncbi:MAG: cytochrome b5 domain-containing protein [Patescibacteria group bacterium]|nr:cytochrome b5 domain-containing protein [Patescibacteria group bacterium]
MLKKITLISLIIFAAIVLVIFGAGFFSAKNTVSLRQGSSQPSASASTTTQTTGPSFTAAEVAKHASASDCYLMINNKVYDVTSYIYQHPGGPSKIISNCGKEVTGIFAAIHSNFAWDILKNYYIGDIVIR